MQHRPSPPLSSPSRPAPRPHSHPAREHLAFFFFLLPKPGFPVFVCLPLKLCLRPAQPPALLTCSSTRLLCSFATPAPAPAPAQRLPACPLARPGRGTGAISPLLSSPAGFIAAHRISSLLIHSLCRAPGRPLTHSASLASLTLAILLLHRWSGHPPTHTHARSGAGTHTNRCHNFVTRLERSRGLLVGDEAGLSLNLALLIVYLRGQGAEDPGHTRPPLGGLGRAGPD